MRAAPTATDMSTGWVASAAYDLSDMSYDPSGNLVAMKRYRETGTLIDNLTYQYTAGTNKLDYTDDAVSTTTETWDAEDGAAGAYAYDANGSATKLPAPYSVTSAAYDARGLVTKVVTGAGTTTYRYNSAGERYWKAGSDYYALDGALQLGVFTTTGTLRHWNIIAGGRVVGRLEGSARKYYHTDHLGTTRAVVEGTCASGCTIRESRDYDAWGVELAGRTFLSGSAAKEGFTGKERDAETGLDYFGARYYLPSVGRWNAVDPLAEKFPGWSPYNYVLNSPMMLVDPDGQMVDECPSCRSAQDEAFAFGQSMLSRLMAIFSNERSSNASKRQAEAGFIGPVKPAGLEQIDGTNGKTSESEFGNPLTEMTVTSGFSPDTPRALTTNNGFQNRVHNGLDLRAVSGTPVLSVGNGRVFDVRGSRESTRGLGLNIRTVLGELRATYGHLDSVTVRAGQRVARGDTIGFSGRSGNVTGANLHFEVRMHKTSRVVNPNTILPKN